MRHCAVPDDLGAVAARRLDLHRGPALNRGRHKPTIRAEHHTAGGSVIRELTTVSSRVLKERLQGIRCNPNW